MRQIEASERPAGPVTGWRIYQLEDYVGGLSRPSKMPGWSYSLPAAECITGTPLRAVPGSACSHCYAYMRGRYGFPIVVAAQYRRLATIGRPLWADVMAELIGRRGARHPYFRWHDSGDLQSAAHLEAICRVAEMTPGVRHWIPTREYRIVADHIRAGRGIPANLNVRMSAHMLGPKVPRFKGLPVTVSTISTGERPAGAHACPAPLQGNNCGSCRACWDRGTPLVDYHLH